MPTKVELLWKSNAVCPRRKVQIKFRYDSTKLAEIDYLSVFGDESHSVCCQRFVKLGFQSFIPDDQLRVSFTAKLCQSFSFGSDCLNFVIMLLRILQIDFLFAGMY